MSTIGGNTVTIISAGTTTITASRPGDVNYNAAVDVQQTLTVNPTGQTITFGPIAAKTLGDAAFSLSATASSNLAVQYSTSSDKITITGSQVALVKAGSVTVNTDQPGNTNYSAAVTVSQTFCIKIGRAHV